MIDFSLNMTGDRRVAYRFGKLEQDWHDKINATVHQLTDKLLARVLAAEPVRTGRLRSQTRESFTDTATTIAGRVRPATRHADAAKAAALEYGAHRLTQVKAHEMTLAHVWDEAIEPMKVRVEAYSRHPNIAAQRFLRDPFAAMQPEIERAFDKVIAGMIAEANA